MSSRNCPECASTREALLEAALFCFADHGFEGTSLRMVADRANRHMSLIAHHFGNKEGLYLEVVKDMLTQRRHCQFQEPLVSPEVLKEDPARAKALLRRVILHIFTNMHATFGSTDPKWVAYYRLWMTALRTPLPELEALMREILAPTRLQIAACIQAIRPDLPLSEIPFWCALVHGQCVVNTMLRPFHELVFGPDCYPPSLERFAEQIADITLRAIGSPETL